MWQWFGSIRSIMSFMIVLSFCFITVWLVIAGKLSIEGKDFVPIVTLIVTFYFVLKDRKPTDTK